MQRVLPRNSRQGTRNRWLTGDALEYRPEQAVDIVVSSLMMHHLKDEEIIALLRWMEVTAQVGWFDLERSEWSCRRLSWWRRLRDGTDLCETMGRCPSVGPSGRRTGRDY